MENELVVPFDSKHSVLAMFSKIEKIEQYLLFYATTDLKNEVLHKVSQRQSVKGKAKLY